MTSRYSNSSSASPRSSIEWRPSRVAALVYAFLGLCGAASALLSGMEARWCWVVGLASVAWGVVLARAEMGRAPRSVVFRSDGSVEIDRTPVERPELAWQGPITLLDARVAGRKTRLVGWPDVIDAEQRRELRLWRLECTTPPDVHSVAP